MQDIILTLKDRKICQNGDVILTIDGLKESLYSNPKLSDNIILDIDKKENDEYEKWMNIFAFNSKKSKNKWFMPEKYQNINLEDVLINKCENEIQQQRIKEELFLYKERNMINFLRFLIYIVDIMRKNDIVWGVGRGSSVSSYALYLIGIHKVDSLKYDLDINEFLRE